MSQIIVATIIARLAVPEHWRLIDMSVDKNMPIHMHYGELTGNTEKYSYISTPFQPRVLTIAHQLTEES